MLLLLAVAMMPLLLVFFDAPFVPRGVFLPLDVPRSLRGVLPDLEAAASPRGVTRPEVEIGGGRGDASLLGGFFARALIDPASALPRALIDPASAPWSAADGVATRDESLGTPRGLAGAAPLAVEVRGDLAALPRGVRADLCSVAGAAAAAPLATREGFMVWSHRFWATLSAEGHRRVTALTRQQSNRSPGISGHGPSTPSHLRS